MIAFIASTERTLILKIPSEALSNNTRNVLGGASAVCKDIKQCMTFTTH